MRNLIGHRLEQQLEEYSGIDPGDGYWVESEPNDLTEDIASETYCHPCAEKRYEALKKEHSAAEFYLCWAGGWSQEENCLHCADCGVVLGYSLLEYGVESELAHFRWRRLEAPLSADEAFHIARILASAPKDRAIRLGRRALQRLR